MQNFKSNLKCRQKRRKIDIMRRIPLRGLLGELGYRMSQSKLIKASIVIPASLYFGLTSHQMYRQYVETPDPIEIQAILS